jgi:hypothetical protein
MVVAEFAVAKAVVMAVVVAGVLVGTSLASGQRPWRAPALASAGPGERPWLCGPRERRP